MPQNPGNSVQVFTTSLIYASEFDVYLFTTNDSLSCVVDRINPNGTLLVKGFDGAGKDIELDGVTVGKPANGEGFYIKE